MKALGIWLAVAMVAISTQSASAQEGDGSDRAFLRYEIEKVDPWGPFVLNLLPGLGIGSFVQGDTTGGLLVAGGEVVGIGLVIAGAGTPEGPFEALARTFKVSPVVAARRALDLDLVARGTFFDFYERYVNREREGGAPPSGGDFYNNQNTRVGELFATQVLRAAMEGRIGFKEAYDLTGLRGGALQKYARRLGVDLP